MAVSENTTFWHRRLIRCLKSSVPVSIATLVHFVAMKSSSFSRFPHPAHGKNKEVLSIPAEFVVSLNQFHIFGLRTFSPHLWLATGVVYKRDAIQNNALYETEKDAWSYDLDLADSSYKNQPTVIDCKGSPITFSRIIEFQADTQGWNIEESGRNQNTQARIYDRDETPGYALSYNWSFGSIIL